jgi:large subunit ribosomal protein L22
MTDTKAQLKLHRQSPRKVRLVADLVRGKKVSDALTLLSFTNKRSALPVKKLISSAIANAKDRSIPTESLIVRKITVDGGPILYRRRPRSRGMTNPIRKRTSHVSLVLSEVSSKRNSPAKSHKLS